jgi:predicted transcriptional regulator
MKVAKMSISMDSDLAARVRAAAERAAQPLSAWIAEAVAARLRSDAITEYLADYQTRHGAFTADELAAARREIGLPDSGGVPL